MITSDVAWVLHKAGSYLPLSCLHHSKFRDVSAVQSPIDGGRAVKMTSGVAWVLHRAGFYSLSNFIGAHDSPLQLRDVKFFKSPISFGKAEIVVASGVAGCYT